MQVDDKYIQPGPALFFQQEILQSQAALLTQPIAGPNAAPENNFAGNEPNMLQNTMVLLFCS
jgi:hypothetical protein